ncbi:MAG: NAD(P)H-binding protein [Gemmatimonadota bacterium]
MHHSTVHADNPTRVVFVTGGTGYIGRRLVTALLARRHTVRVLARPGSESRVAAGAQLVTGDALHGLSYAAKIGPADTFVHLVGVANPGPAKAAQFQAVDLVSIETAVPAAVTAGIRHFVYLSVAQPAPVMRAYVAVRATGESLLRESGLNATFMRPWYVIGPGHRWPLLLIPGYAIGRMLPATRETAIRLGLVSLGEIVRTLVHAVEQPREGVHIVDVPQIRKARL